MRLVLISLLYVVTALILQGTLLSDFPWPWIRIDFILPFVLYLSFYIPWSEGVVAILVMGVMTDLLATPVFGLFTAVYFLLYSLVRLLAPHIHFEGEGIRLLWVFLFTFIAFLLEWVLCLWLGLGRALIPYFLMAPWGQAFLNVALCIWLYRLFEKRRHLLYLK